MKDLVAKMAYKMKETPGDIEIYEDMFQLCRAEEEMHEIYCHKVNEWLRDRLVERINYGVESERFYELWRRSLLFDAPYKLDPYLLYLEINRPPEARFYQPRRKVLKQIVDSVQMLIDDQLDELFLSLPPRVGKLLSDDTPVLTTKGWKKHGDLKIGDYVYSPEGKPVRVYAIHPKYHTTHTVTTSDGSKIECHENHEWRVFNRWKGKWEILETKEMIGRLESGGEEHKRGHRYMFMLENRQPMKGTPQTLHVKPYTMGAWLGDGTTCKPAITTPDAEIMEGVVADGYEVSRQWIHKDTKVPTWYFKNLMHDLGKYGMCRERKTVEKFLPQEYIIAPIEDRLQLLAGLIDTDGTLTKKEKRYIISSTNENIRDGVVALVSTFGWRCSVRSYAPKTSTSGIHGRKTVWTIAFNPTMEIPCRVPRKQLKTFSKQRRQAIVDISPSEHKQGNCITVVGGMYCVGERMIPTHNTSLIDFIMTFIMAKRSESPSLYSAYSDTITSAFYGAVLEIITDKNIYTWNEIFPTSKIVRTNAADETIDIDRRKHYPTLTCRSIDGTLNGACDAQNGFIIGDDLVSGIEEALSKDRLVSKWNKVDNNLIPRGKGRTKYLWIGTRWSVIDPIGLRLDVLQNEAKFVDYRYKVINIPALNEKDESNFDYPYGVGFSTIDYQRRRASFERNNDMASWNAQYMGQPIEREGTLYAPADFRYYNGDLPEGDPDRIFMPIDPAFGGEDYVAGPVCYQYGEDIYIPAVIYNNGDKKVTQPMIASLVQTYNIDLIDFEETKSTASYREETTELLKKKELRPTIMSHTAPNDKSKQQRIFDSAPDVRDHMIFLTSGKRNKEYELFMNNVFSFRLLSSKTQMHHRHDDAPDSLAMAIKMLKPKSRKISAFRRPF